MRDHIEFFRQFRSRFETTGAVAPSSRFLARAMTGPMRKRQRPARILEVGPGTGAVTQSIVAQMRDGDRLDMVELNETFAGILNRRLENEAAFQRVADRAQVHCCPLQEFDASEPFDYIISGLPLNNFSPELVRSIFEHFIRLLAPNGTLSYFEYMYVRQTRMKLSAKPVREKLSALDGVIRPYLDQHRFHTSWVFLNIPPAWVQHLRR